MVRPASRRREGLERVNTPQTAGEEAAMPPAKWPCEDSMFDALNVDGVVHLAFSVTGYQFPDEADDWCLVRASVRHGRESFEAVDPALEATELPRIGLSPSPRASGGGGGKCGSDQRTVPAAKRLGMTAMLNLSFIFDDANVALAESSDLLAIAPLPAAVYLMQVDVLNHYRYALTHYFALTLNEPFLQKSSLGTPYQKWAFFVNKDFEMLSFAIHNLLRYTSRLVHETGCASTNGKSYHAKSNAYTAPLCDIGLKDKPIGVRVDDHHQLTVTAIRVRPHPFPVIMRSDGNGPAEFVRVVKDAGGGEHEEPTDGAEFDRAMEALDSETLDIRDRSRLERVRERGMREIVSLSKSNRVFGEACNGYYASRNVASPFQRLNKWV